MLAGMNWGPFLIALLVIELTPGPNMGWLATLSARAGLKIGMKAVAGVTLGLTIQMFAAVLGLSAILAGSDILYELLRWAGVAFMLYLAWESWREMGEPSPVHAHQMPSFKRGLIANLLNPKALVFYLVVVSQFADPARGQVWLQTLILGSIHVILSVAIHSAIVFAGAGLGETLKTWQSSVIVRAMFTLALVLIAVWIAVSTGR